MTIRYQVIEIKCLHAFWILFGNSTGLLNRDCLTIWQRFKTFPTKNRWLRWSLKIALPKTLICWNIYYYRPNCKERVFALDSSLPLHLKGDAKITFVNTFTGRSFYPSLNILKLPAQWCKYNYIRKANSKNCTCANLF